MSDRIRIKDAIPACETGTGDQGGLAGSVRAGDELRSALGLRQRVDALRGRFRSWNRRAPPGSSGFRIGGRRLLHQLNTVVQVENWQSGRESLQKCGVTGGISFLIETRTHDVVFGHHLVVDTSFNFPLDIALF